MLIRPLRLLLIPLIICFYSATTLADTENPPLSGAVVKNIVDRFVAMHYSQHPLDNSISQKMFTSFLKRLDPGHYYFLESDIKEYQKYDKQFDDMLQRGNIEIALKIFTRFKTRLRERLQMLEEFIKGDFDFSKDASWQIDRKNAPYPKNTEEARKIWRLRVKFDLLTLKLGGNTIEEAKDRLLKRVRGAWKDYSKYKDNDVVSMFLNAFTAAYDPHSSYLAAQDLKNFDISIKLSLEGIGAVLRWEDGYTVVNSIIPGGAAYRDGRLKVNDRIIGVAQGAQPFESVIDMRLNNVVQLIRGKRGTQVRLQVLRKSEAGYDTLTLSIVRDKIVLKDGEAQAKIFDSKSVNPNDPNENAPQAHKIGVIHLPSFYIDFNGRRKNPRNYKSSSRDVKKHLQHFNTQKVDGVILDLRSNGGGGLDEAIAMAGLFIGRQPVVIVRQSGGYRTMTHRSRERAIYTGPLLLMLNRYSASASEIMAGALQDYQRAILVGDKTTFGKGTVQNIVQLPQGLGALKVTIAQFYRVSGWSTQNRGVESSIVLPSLNNVRDIGESTLENALPWKAIAGVSYRRKGNVNFFLPELSKISQNRTAKNKFFQEVNTDIQEYLTKIKPLKYTSILKMQDDYNKRRAKHDEALAKVTSSDNKTKAVVEEAPKPETADKLTIQKDPYLNEGILILEDYIRLLHRKKR